MTTLVFLQDREDGVQPGGGDGVAAAVELQLHRTGLLAAHRRPGGQETASLQIALGLQSDLLCPTQRCDTKGAGCVMQGRRLSQVHRMFPTGLVLGVYSTVTKETSLNPPAATRVKAGDVLVMMRPTNVAPSQYVPIPEPVPIDLGEPRSVHTQPRTHLRLLPVLLGPWCALYDGLVSPGSCTCTQVPPPTNVALQWKTLPVVQAGMVAIGPRRLCSPRQHFRAGGWDATSYVQRSHDEAPASVMGSREESLQRQAGFSGQPRVVGKPGPNAANQCTGLYMLPLEYTTSSDEPEVRFRDPSTRLLSKARSFRDGTCVGVNLKVCRI